jgi:dihydroceramidase
MLSFYGKTCCIYPNQFEKMKGQALVYSTVAVFCCNLYLIFSIVKYGETGNYKDDRAGYWGEKTANTNWCEPDYVVSHYVAEFWNTMSSFLIFFYGIYGIVMHPWAERRFFTALCCFIVVGLGSAAFHATLWRSMQLMDELPMLWSNSAFSYAVHFMERKGSPNFQFVAVLAVVTCILTYSVIEFDKEDQVIFLLSYGSGVGFLMYQSILLRKKYTHTQKHVDLGLFSVFLYLLGFCVWLTDRRFCPTVQNLHLHSWWHFCAGTGTFMAILFWMQVREAFKGEQKVVYQNLSLRRVPKEV